MSYPRAIYVETTTRCNLHCAMCPKHGQETVIQEADLAFSTFERLAPSLARCRILRLNGLGEPLLHPGLPDMIALARAYMPVDGNIGFQTNGLLLDAAKAVALLDAGLDTLCCSVDSLQTAASGQRQHDGSATEAVGRHMQRIAALARWRPHPSRQLALGCQMVITRENMHELPDMVAWTAQHDGTFLIVSHMLPYTAQSEKSHLFDYDTEEAQAYFAAQEREAAAQGLDLRSFYSVGWKYAKSAEEQALASMVAQMLDLSMRRGAPLNLRRLMQRDHGVVPESQQKLAEIFADAQRIAQKLGVRLELPQRAARVARSCVFSEEGWAFVDVQGRVSPCYFLWHESVCWVDGLRKKVWPVFWGNINDTPLQVLWECENWRAFRKDSAAWDMPDCFACTAACADMKGEFGPFEVDCYGAKAPCGHCPWSQGALRCMV